MMKSPLHSGMLVGGTLCACGFTLLYFLLPKVGPFYALSAVGFLVMATLLSYYMGKVASDAEMEPLVREWSAKRSARIDDLQEENAALQAKIAELEALTSPQIDSRLTSITSQDRNCDDSDLGGAPLATRERNSLLVIVAALAKEANVNLDEPYKAARVTVNIAEQLGVRMSENAVANHFKRVPDALDSRSQ